MYFKVNSTACGLLMLLVGFSFYSCSKQEAPRKRLNRTVRGKNEKVKIADVNQARIQELFRTFRSTRVIEGPEADKYDAGLVIFDTYDFVGLSRDEVTSLLGDPDTPTKGVDNLMGTKKSNLLSYHCMKGLERYELVYVLNEKKPQSVIGQYCLTNEW